MGTLAVLQARQERRRVFAPHYRPAVSVVIAAYNEAKVVNQTIATLLASDYPDLDIVVVDDGSRDGTADVVRAAYGSDPRVTVLAKSNGGKASALNLGIKECRGDIIVALDADTHFAPDTVSRLVRHFQDPDIGAVSGNVKVGNRDNPLTLWQAVEYITSQNFDRRAFDLLNCITVVPGAVGAWRKDAVILAGLYSSQTLAEDTDLTFKIRKLGYRIVTDNSALAYTEAPETLQSLAKQRFRWAFGTLQCLWKHRDVLGRPRYGAFGLVALPSLWVYQIAFQALAPIVDLAIAWSLIYGTWFAPSMAHGDVLTLLGYWAVFSTVEIAGAWVAFTLDREDKRLLGWLLLQRFVYRQLMYYVIVKSLVTAVRGSLVGWGKLERRGTVKTPTASSSGPPSPPILGEDSLQRHSCFAPVRQGSVKRTLPHIISSPQNGGGRGPHLPRATVREYGGRRSVAAVDRNLAGGRFRVGKPCAPSACQTNCAGPYWITVSGPRRERTRPVTLSCRRSRMVCARCGSLFRSSTAQSPVARRRA